MPRKSAVIKKLKEENPELKTNRKLQKSDGYYRPVDKKSNAIITPTGKALSNNKKIVFNLEVGEVVKVKYESTLGIIISTTTYKVKDYSRNKYIQKTLESDKYLVFVNASLKVVHGKDIEKIV
jgi:hypothetical protein